ncbi:MAG: hypothetical protein EXR31_06210 [Betaproteobacteria bacterium]|nr:hypothetical protein [Betaproteobacteria bacterium]
MKNLALVLAMAAGLAFGSFAAQAKLPPPPAKSDAEKAAEAEKAAVAKAKEAELNAKYVDKAVANYNKNKGIVGAAVPASKSGKK